MALKPITVSQLNEYISRILNTDPLLGNISVVGEISNLKYHGSGHIYFSVIDNNSKINCFMASNYVKNLEFELTDGMEITIHGYINVYKKGGTYTLFVRSIDVSGEGNLSVAFQLLKDKLDKEGLFDSKYKKPIPQFPQKVGVVTSETGAAAYDIIKIIKSRNSLTDIVLFPVLVQGKDAGRDIARMITHINENCNDIDVLIVGRGGGSTEDLWAFNEEIVARAIFECDIPVISAVGHEIDFTISDFVADRRAETPTAAAEMAVPDISVISQRMNGLKNELYQHLNNKVRYNQLLADNLFIGAKDYLLHRIGELQHFADTRKVVLEENNPMKIMSSGYSIVSASDGSILKSIDEFKEGETFVLTLQDGSAEFKPENIRKAGNKNDI